MDEKFLVELRDCFTAGYTFPQYCIDNQIKKPLFVSEKKFLDFIWQVYVQFHYDKRIFARFCFIDSGKAEESFTCHPGIDGILKYRNVSDINLNSFDGIILLTKEMLNCTDKTISLTDLIGFFRKKTFVEIPLSKFLFLHPQVNLILTKLPSIERFKGGKEFNSTLWEADELANAIVNSGGNHIETPLDKFGYTNEQVAELILSSKIKRNADGTSSMLDGNYPLRRIQNGKRATAYQPEHFQNRIYFFGSCHHYGVNAPFDKTIESYLQQMLNENNLPYRVENESQHFAHRYQDIFYNLNKIIPSPGDIIFFWIFDEESNDNNIPFFDVSDAFDPPYDFREIYCRKGHVNELGYKLLAKKHFEYLTENNFFRDVKFNYPLFPPPISQIRHTSLGRARRRKVNCRQRGVGILQRTTQGKAG